MEELVAAASLESMEASHRSQWEQGRAPRGDARAGIPVLLPPCRGKRDSQSRQLLLHKGRSSPGAQEASKAAESLIRVGLFSREATVGALLPPASLPALLSVLPWYLVSTKDLLAQRGCPGASLRACQGGRVATQGRQEYFSSPAREGGGSSCPARLVSDAPPAPPRWVLMLLQPGQCRWWCS